MVDTIVQSFETWTDAQGIKSKGRVKSVDNISLEGISKLRGLILSLALQGKLGTSDNNDIPSSKLLIQIEKQREEQKVKKMPLLDIKDIEIPYELPHNWEFVRLHQIIRISSGDGLTASKMNKDGEIPVFGGNGITGSHDKNNVTKSTLVIGRVGFYCGSVHITPELAWVTDNAFITSFSDENIDIDFLSWLLKGTNLKENDSATAQPVISGRKIYPIVVGFPPLEEQKRIVAKVDELMALCDKLEEEQTNNLKTHALLVKTLLETLTQAKDANELQVSWERMSTHFDTLFCTEDSIKQLKQTILQLAVMGKLVKQDPNDETASALLKKIATEKALLIKEGKIKKEKPLDIITDEEMPFVLPTGWAWVKCQNICYKITDGEHATPKRSSSGYYLLSARNVTNEGILLDNVDYVPSDEFERIRKRCDPNIGDILISCSGSVGRVALVDKDNAYAMVRSAAMIRPFQQYFNNKYLALLLRSPYLQTQIVSRSRQSAQANLFLGAISNLVFIIPPLSEQNRIVNNVSELFALCDTLKSKIIIAQELKGLLSKTIVEKAVQ